jgi:hypothetical protein
MFPGTCTRRQTRGRIPRSEIVTWKIWSAGVTRAEALREAAIARRGNASETWLSELTSESSNRRSALFAIRALMGAENRVLEKQKRAPSWDAARSHA